MFVRPQGPCISLSGTHCFKVDAEHFLMMHTCDHPGAADLANVLQDLACFKTPLTTLFQCDKSCTFSLQTLSNTAPWICSYSAYWGRWFTEQEMSHQLNKRQTETRSKMISDYSWPGIYEETLWFKTNHRLCSIHSPAKLGLPRLVLQQQQGDY